MKNNDIYQRWLWILWPTLTLCSLLGMAFLATHPSFMLWIEESHPSAAYVYGDKLRRQDQLHQAIDEYHRGAEFFKNLYEEHLLPSHRRQWVLGLLRQADTYSELDSSEAMQNALALYNKAIELEPDMSRGQPYLARAQLLTRMEQYPQAIESYNQAMKKGQGHTDLISYYGRGLCYMRLDEYEKAADDWYLFTRYVSEPEPEQIQIMLALPENANPKHDVIIGYLNLLRQKIEPALRHLKNYLDTHSQDRFARYARAMISNATYTADQGKYALEECFPPSEKRPRLLETTLIDIFTHQSQMMQLSARLSTPATAEVLPQVNVDLSTGENITVLSSDPETYETTLSLQKGRNLVRLETLQQDPNQLIPHIYLHSLYLQRANDTGAQ